MFYLSFHDHAAHTEVKLRKAGGIPVCHERREWTRMQAVLLNSLRSGDVATRYSMPLLVMLPGCQYENARMGAERDKL